MEYLILITMYEPVINQRNVFRCTKFDNNYNINNECIKKHFYRVQENDQQNL